MQWAHARATLADTLVPHYERLAQTGWCLTDGEIRRDIGRLLGGAYEEFMHK
jgi:hypothetical protein